MFEIDKNSFGEFLTQQRKAKGYTQKELADKLYVSDKAVSKWERAQSMPDISLLMPLAELLDVSVTELLEGRKLDASSGLDASQVEAIVKKALSLSEDTPEKKKARLKKHAAIFGGCVLLTLLEFVVGLWCLHRLGITFLNTSLLTLECLSFGFGIYFWFFMREKLPAYYDENKINAFSDGFFRMNVPGLYFNNSNWLPIVKYLRAWSAVSLLLLPLPCFVLSAKVFGSWWVFVLLPVFLLSLFAPVYFIGKKYEDGGKSSSQKRSWLPALALVLLMLAFPIGLNFLGVSSRSVTRINYTGNAGLRTWSARYSRLDGVMSKRLYPESDATDYVIEVDTEAGSLTIELRDSSGSIVFSGEELQSGSYPVTLTGTSRVIITAKDHTGGFAIKPQ